MTGSSVCSVPTFVPFTNAEVPTHHVGFSHMAGAVMAMEDFNNRNPSVVPSLGDLDCDIVFGDTRVYDTGTTTHQATTSILQDIQENGIPCAIAGPANDIPAVELSVVATGIRKPIVAHWGSNFRLTDPALNPFFTQLNPSFLDEAKSVLYYLLHQKRTDFVVILHNLYDSTIQRVETLQIILQDAGIQTIRAPYLSPGAEKALADNLEIPDTMKRVKQSGYRTIVVITDDAGQDLPSMATAARDNNLSDGEHFWLFKSGPEIEFLTMLDDPSLDSPLVDFLQGTAFILPLDGFQVEPSQDPFMASWRSKNASFVDRLNTLSPVPSFTANDDFFQTNDPILGTGFLYDAVIAIGLGACEAARKSNHSAFTGEDHLREIQLLNFEGATGWVMYNPEKKNPGTRKGVYATYGVLNLFPPVFQGGERPSYVLTSVHDGGRDNGNLTRAWKQLTPFYFPNGETTPPELLRDLPEQNYLDSRVRAVGLALMSTVLFCSLLAVVWVLLNRASRVVKASQPFFLYWIAAGAAIGSLPILFQSFDESYGVGDNALDRMCVAVPWLSTAGHIITYSALFTKLWRVNRVLQFSRRRIEVKHVVGPAVVLFLSTILVLSLWTGLKDYGWKRVEIDSSTGETIGKCTGSESYAFLVPTLILALIPTVLTGVMAWKTKDVDRVYSESSWIFSLMLVHMQVAIMGLPVIAILQDLSTNGRYIGLSLLTWSIPMSTLGLIMLPKVISLRQTQLGDDSRRSTRGSQQGIRVTGMQSATMLPDGSSSAPPNSNDEKFLTGSSNGTLNRTITPELYKP